MSRLKLFRLVAISTAYPLLVSILAGCALGDAIQKVTLSAAETDSKVTASHNAFAQMVSSPQLREQAQHVDRPWLAGRSLPLAREVTLPTALRSHVRTTLLFSDGPIGLTRVARRITQATGIPVYVHPEALLSNDLFTQRLSGAGSAQTRVGQNRQTVSLSGESEPLARILDRVAAALGVYWRYEHERIEFYRTETRIFNVRALTLAVQAQAALGAGRKSGDSGFASSSRTELQSDAVSVMEVVEARIQPFLTQAGVAVAHEGGSALVVVTDTPQVLQQVAGYLEKENRALTRRVRLIFEEITLMTNDSVEAGVDWNIVFSSARVAAAAAAPGAIAADMAQLGLGIRKGPFSGSEAIVSALGKVGKVIRRSSVPVLTLNRRPVTHAVRTTFSYIDRVESSVSGNYLDATLPTVSISQKEETVGSLLTLVPDAQEDGQILLSLAYDNTVAQPLKSITFGDSNNPLQLQQVTIDGNGTVQQLALRPGQPVLVSGFDRSQESADLRRLNPGMPLVLGGNDKASQQRLKTVIVITAQVEEGF
ncbi:hypothetical protein [Neopusillimonas maritima]|jgi:type IVB pilus formation R64 PilN family outer membrane protein|uniref:Uncharacterized protein n=1 Tax=Neopusillimonas maritima TaxID=2026239 RepID=A0ABX9MTR0_9BURK|nr:hypothetical protein [Neopusillimonas maritima]RII81968.1 hypothetical protein CJO09_13245 [Neopusillimonas maritima]